MLQEGIARSFDVMTDAAGRAVDVRALLRKDTIAPVVEVGKDH